MVKEYLWANSLGEDYHFKSTFLHCIALRLILMQKFRNSVRAQIYISREQPKVHTEEYQCSARAFMSWHHYQTSYILDPRYENQQYFLSFVCDIGACLPVCVKRKYSHFS